MKKQGLGKPLTAEGCLMNVVIIGGNDCMVCHYKAICKEYAYKAKIFTQPKGNLEGLIGNPDLIVLFTNPVSHEMVKVAKKEAARKDILLVQSHCGSANSLRNLLAGVSLTPSAEGT